MRPRQQGFTYLAILFTVALSSIAMGAGAALWTLESRREKEQELLFAGDQLRAAIGRYYESTPGELKQFPASLEQLLWDSRHAVPQRHLRRLYADPLSGKPDWGLVRTPSGAIMGVYSRSPQRPVKQARFADRHERFAGRAHYADWQFIYEQGYVRYTPAVFE